MTVTKAKKAANQRYDAKTYDKVLLRLNKGSETSKENVQKAADAAGESLNSFITGAIKQRMQRNNGKQ